MGFRGTYCITTAPGYPVGLYISFQWAPPSILNNLLYWIGTIPLEIWYQVLGILWLCMYSNINMMFWGSKMKTCIANKVFCSGQTIIDFFQSQEFHQKFYVWLCFKNIMCQMESLHLDFIYEDVIVINLSPPGQNGCHFADDILRCIFMNEKFSILIKISLKFVPKGQIDNDPTLV